MFTPEKPLLSYVLLKPFNIWFDNTRWYIKLPIVIILLILVFAMFHGSIPFIRGLAGGIWSYWFACRVWYLLS